MLLLLPDIVPAEAPAGEAHEHRQASGKIEEPVKARCVRADDGADLVRLHNLAEPGRAGGEYGLGIHVGSCGVDSGDEAVVEDGVGDADEDGPAEPLHEYQDGQDDCDLGVGEDGLHGE